MARDDLREGDVREGDLCDGDLAEERHEIGRDLVGLANALTAHGDALVEAVLVDLTRRRRAVREEPSTRRWARDRLSRRSLKHPSDPLALPDDDAGPRHDLDAARVLAVVRSLPPLPRAALVLALVDDLDELAVARSLDVSPTRAAAALTEARTLVAARLPGPARPEAPPVVAGEAAGAPADPVPDDAFTPPWRRSGR